MPLGGARVDGCEIVGAAAVRLAAWPPEAGAAPASFAVDPGSKLTWAPRSSKLPFGLSFWREEGRWVFEAPLPTETRCLGLGERYGGLELRGRVHTLITTDDHRHTEATDSLYKAIPFLVLEHGGEYRGLFLDSPAPQRWDLDSGLEGHLRVELISRRGFELYAIGPTTLPSLIAAFTTLTGRSELPPRWSLGHQQSRWSYPNEETVRAIAGELRRRALPTDTLVVDIDYMDEYRVFSVSRERFPGFERMVEELRADGFRVVPILDPGVKFGAGEPVFASGLERDVFCRRPDGALFIGRVWAGDSVFPDFTRADVREWWGEQLESLAALGVSGVWCDMNEPSLFGQQRPLEQDAVELPPDATQPFTQEPPEGRVGHLEVRNVYGLQMARATREALDRLRPDERAFMLNRSCFAGMQRFGAVWLGDNYSWFEHLRLSLPMLVNVGLSGVPFCGVDVGGFGLDCDGELLARWYQLGIFYPFLRNHCAMEGRPQEPWRFGERVERAIRRLLEVRYSLIPYLENLFAEHVETGAPLLRPLEWHAPGDSNAADVEDEAMLGPDLLVAPIVQRGRTARTVYLPDGRWYPFDGGAPLEGGRFHRVGYELHSVPAFVRDGAIVPLAGPMQSTSEYETVAITFRVFGTAARGRYREDDGSSRAWRRGAYDEWDLEYESGTLRAVARRLGYGRAIREYFVQAGENRHVIVLPRG